ncbi:serine/threonine-protein kinase [Massilia horti]|uniref:non-specific serine/threonine protein kinase n=1 Tax=Massilia horti TaxID=2562153 RepID=A0A4Y9SQA2_9BURK|nr:serine/threonine-protein kinase [Massilia horti]TFW28942.1 serine/threonine protein kinase [Massilia horti]
MLGQLGKYRLDSVLGKGAMGVVYKAFDPVIERVVALKTIRKELFSDSQQLELVSRFKNEAQAAGRLNHPNIVTVYDYGEDNESAYIAMEYVEGAPLDALIRSGQPCPLPRVMAWMSGLLLALDYAHARGVVHRDIKPGNLLLSGGTQVKVSDFGIARIESSTLTQTGTLVGTPSYMSPEQLRAQTVDGRSDVFSAGVLLYQLLTGVRPFSGAPAVVMQQILNDRPVAPSAHVPTLGQAFDDVVARALAKQADARYPSARAFLDALSAAVNPDATISADEDRTVLVVPGAPDVPPSTMPGGSLASDTITPWKIAALPELEPLLAQQVGPMARILLKKEAARSDGIDALCALLLAHIPSEEGRAQFQSGVVQLKKKLAASGTGTGSQFPTSPTGDSLARDTGTALNSSVKGAVPLDETFAERVAERLTVLLGPIARVMVKRAARQAGDKSEFLQLIAANIESSQDRARFLAEAASL